jgi:hypothetical protein
VNGLHSRIHSLAQPLGFDSGGRTVGVEKDEKNDGMNASELQMCLQGQQSNTTTSSTAAARTTTTEASPRRPHNHSQQEEQRRQATFFFNNIGSESSTASPVLSLNRTGHHRKCRVGFCSTQMV